MAGKKGMKHAKPLDPDCIDRIRHRILQSKIANRMIDHANGLIELSPSQVQAATALLRKVVPDLSAVEHSGSVDTFTTLLQSLDTSRTHQNAPESTQQVTKLPDPVSPTETLQ